jgi:hypothetical protein
LLLLLLLLALDEGLVVNPPLPGTNSFAPTFNFVTTEAAVEVMMLLLLLLPPSVVVDVMASGDALDTNSPLLLLIRTKEQ